MKDQSLIMDLSGLTHKKRHHLQQFKRMALRTLLIVMLLLSTTGCTEDSSDLGFTRTSGGGATGTLADIETSGFRYEEELIAKERKQMLKKYQRQYGSPLYFEDFSSTEKRLSEELEKLLEAECSKIANGPVVVKCRLHLYTDLLKRAQDQNLSINTVLKNPEEAYFQTADIELVGFTGETRKYELDQMEKNIFYLCVDYSSRPYVALYPIKTLRKHKIEELRTAESPLVPMTNEPNLLTSSIGYGAGVKTPAEMAFFLNQKYGERFVLVNSEWGPLFCPEGHEELSFDARGIYDMYLPVLEQVKMGDSIRNILEEEQAAGSIAFFVRTVREIDSLDTPKFDSEKPLDKERLEAFKNKEYMSKIDKWSESVALMYLLAPGEQVDYTKLKAVVARVQGLKKMEVTVRIYHTSSHWKNVVLDLFRRNPVPDRTISTADDLELIRTAFLHRTDSEGFRVLDMFTELENRYAPYFLTDVEAEDVETFKTKHFKPYEHIPR